MGGGVAWTPSRVGAFVLFCPLHLNSTDPPFVEPREAPFNLTVTNSGEKRMPFRCLSRGRDALTF